MKQAPLQNLSLVICLIVSAALLFWFIPSQLPKSEPVTKQEEDLKNVLQHFLPPPVTAGAIKIKGSGEDPHPAPNTWDGAENTQDPDFDDWNASYETADFSIPPSLQSIVNFWIQIFSRYGKNQYVFHHRDDVGLVYSTLDLSTIAPESMGITENEADRLINQALIEEKARIRKTLGNLDSDAIRVQGGFAHRFRQGIALSGKYMEEMERIFSSKGLPVELTRLPLIESAFNLRAISTADAAGIWQFIPETGAKYLKIDDRADERYDPILSTYAAAQHLAGEYDLLKSWPLTINAYNTGAGRMLKAIGQLGTDDITTIIRHFKDPGYQFYSRNYYPEFLAALHVYENQEKYFGVIEKEPPLLYDIFMPEEEINLNQLAGAVHVDEGVMAQLNPALSENVLKGTKNLPPGYLVRVPENMGEVFANGMNRLKTEEVRLFAAQEGDTLDSVAKTLQVSVEALQKENNFYRDQKLQAGTMLKLPVDGGVAMNPDERGKTVIP